MRITEHISTLPSAIQPEVSAIATSSWKSMVSVAAHLAAIVTLGAFEKINERADKWDDFQLGQIPVKTFLICGTCCNQAFRNDLDGENGYRTYTNPDNLGISPTVMEFVSETSETRIEALSLSFRYTVAVIKDFAIGCFLSLKAACNRFENKELNKKALENLAGLTSFHDAFKEFRKAISLPDDYNPFYKAPDPRLLEPLLED